MAIRDNITIEEGATFVRDYQWEQPTVDNPQVGNDAHWEPVDLTGFSAMAEIRDRPGGNLLLRIDSADVGGIELEPEDDEGQPRKGVVRVRIGATRTEGLSGGGVWDLELHLDADPDSVVRLVEGSVTISPEVTRHA